MPHMVTYRSPDGNPAYHEMSELDEAIRFVERLRNEEQVTEARIFEMREVSIKFKTYYQVEVDAPEADKPKAASVEAPKAEAVAAQPAPPQAAAPQPATAPQPAAAPKVAATKGEAPAAQPAEAAANGGGRFGLFGKQ